MKIEIKTPQIFERNKELATRTYPHASSLRSHYYSKRPLPRL